MVEAAALDGRRSPWLTSSRPARVSTAPEKSKAWVQPPVVKATTNKPLAAVARNQQVLRPSPRATRRLRRSVRYRLAVPRQAVGHRRRTCPPKACERRSRARPTTHRGAASAKRSTAAEHVRRSAPFGAQRSQRGEQARLVVGIVVGEVMAAVHARHDGRRYLGFDQPYHATTQGFGIIGEVLRGELRHDLRR